MSALRPCLTAFAAGFLAALTVGFDARAGDLSGYFTLDEYYQLHPDQERLSAAFSETVRAPAAPVAITQVRPVRVLVVYPGLQVSDYWRRSVATFRRRLEELGVEAEILDHFTRPGTELRQQSQLIQQGLDASPDYLVFTLDALRHRGIVERILALRSTKIILQNITTPIRAFEPNQPFLYVGFDHAMGSKMLADRVKQAKPDGARFAILYGPEGYVSAMRGGVFLEQMRDHGNSSLVASYYVNFDRERAYLATKDLLSRHDDLDLIYACSTDIALGVIDALKELGKLDDILVNGWGGGAAELDAIAAGELDFTVMRMNDDNGIAMAEAIRMDLTGRGDSVPSVYSGDFKLVDRTTSSADMAQLRAYAFRYSN